MKTLHLELSLNEVNFILETLGQMPFLKVSDLITKIQQQGKMQISDLEIDADEEDGEPAAKENETN